MDEMRFDLTVRAIGRRGLLRGTLAVLAADLALPFREARAGAAACVKRGPGERCRNGGQCCSNRCRKKKDKRFGRCRCGALNTPCAEDGDCCGHDPFVSTAPVCDVGTLGASQGKRCCKLNQAPCETSFDCCSPFVCDTGTRLCRSE